MRFTLSALLAFGSAAPAAAQVRVAVPGSVSVVPSFSPALSPGLAPSFSAPAVSLSLTPGLLAPSIGPSLSPAALAPSAPIPALAAPAISATAFQPALVPTALLRPVSAPARDGRRHAPDAPRVVTNLKDIGRLVGMVEAADAAKAFDGAAAKTALAEAGLAEVPFPSGAKRVSVVRLNTASDASAFIPHTSNTENFIRELPAKWENIGWLDMRVYTDNNGGKFHTLDITGRPELLEHLPEMQPHETVLIRKIQLHAKDLQLMIREEGKTPDLIVDGVVTEMKSLFPGGEFKVQLAHANAQVLEHGKRHRLAPGAAAIELTARGVVPVAELRHEINAFVRTGAEIGLSSVHVYAGKERVVFVRGKDGLFDLPANVNKPSGRARRAHARRWR